MTSSQTNGRSTRRKRGSARGQLRRETTIDGLIVEEAFTLSAPEGNATKIQINRDNENQTDGASVGDGCYVSTTVHNRRYYGLLVDQSALKAASHLFFQDEANSLAINRRMIALNEQKVQGTSQANSSNELSPLPCGKRLLESSSDQPFKKSKTNGISNGSYAQNLSLDQAVQKFKYVEGKTSFDGYRVLLATYSDALAASEDDQEKALKIDLACKSGGDWIGNYYYQYQVPGNTLHASTSQGNDKKIGIRTSMSFHNFLNDTILPSWYPLSNLECGQSKVLSMLQLKKNNKGEIQWDSSQSTSLAKTKTTIPPPAIIPMPPRETFRIGIVGGGIAGLACATELLRIAESEDDALDIEVVLFEGRSRVGGRVNTDYETFKKSDGTVLPVDLGASWIHGTTLNPLTSLAGEAGVELVKASEDVKMLRGKMHEIERDLDSKMGDIFDELLDYGAEHSWNQEEYDMKARNQKATRWYASVLGDSKLSLGEEGISPSDVPPNRHSSDISIDQAIGYALQRRIQKTRTRLSTEEQNLLLWNTKNTEYALGANICDLSMKYWDTDETHAFEGAHVLLKQGFSALIEHLLKKCTGNKNFTLIKNCPVGRIEYALNSTSHPYPKRVVRSKSTINLSNTCRITSRNGKNSQAFDFVVSALPLGVLKSSLTLPSKKQLSSSDVKAVNSQKLSFNPPLPHTKQDAIRNVGFGLLNKVYLQFPSAFWRKTDSKDSLIGSPFLSEFQNLFGNASGKNPQYYMFLDVGKSLGVADNTAVLLTLISGSEAVKSEQLSEQSLVNEVMETLKYLFSDINIPSPIAYKLTRWGLDEFSRGSYTFLPPGCTDQDYHILQSPVNGKGDAISEGNSEVMRLFWAGEHTSSHFPSMAHGAYLSGIRAARDVYNNINFNASEDRASSDLQIPITVYRTKHPTKPLNCNLCGLSGSRKREGALLAFQRGSRQVLAHSHCVEFSPEVELRHGVWKHVIKAVNRGNQIKCSLCGKSGGTIGCVDNDCSRTFHFACCEEWDFEQQGKAYRCKLHRGKKSSTSNEPSVIYVYKANEKQILLNHFKIKNPGVPLSCALCNNEGDCKRRGELLGFEREGRQLLIHKNCLQYTNVVETVDTKNNNCFQNVFEAVNRSRECFACKVDGASIKCNGNNCFRHFHFSCCENIGWNFENDGNAFLCPIHMKKKPTSQHLKQSSSIASRKIGNLSFKHDLFMSGAQTVNANEKKGSLHRARTRLYTPTNAEDLKRSLLEDSKLIPNIDKTEPDEVVIEKTVFTDLFFSDSQIGKGGEANKTSLHLFVDLRRFSTNDPWNLELIVDFSKGKTTLQISSQIKTEHSNKLMNGDVVVGLNGSKVGSSGLKTLSQVLSLFEDSVDLRFEVNRSLAK